MKKPAEAPAPKTVQQAVKDAYRVAGHGNSTKNQAKKRAKGK